jgi:hypothetical protein
MIIENEFKTIQRITSKSNNKIMVGVKFLLKRITAMFRIINISRIKENKPVEM